MGRSKSSLTSLSRYLSMILRHKPEAIGITLDRHGWADVDQVIRGIGRTRAIDRQILEEIVRTDEKGRYSFNEDHTRIRANQGHSVPVDVELEERRPPRYLYHGTGEKSVPAISREGLRPMGRLYVHLSPDFETAVRVGRRHGKPHVYLVESGKMAKDGRVFYLSVNGVWLTKQVPPAYLRNSPYGGLPEEDQEKGSPIKRIERKMQN